jgi:dTDP-4-dehydrorhamnose 3,5-epimerase
MRFHQDDRAIRYCDPFPLKEGDINISVIYPKSLAAWHRHQHQSDHWLVVKGALKVGLGQEGQPLEFQYLSEREPKVLVIPPNVWHGYYNFTDETAILIYYITNKYDPDAPDEERMKADLAQWEREIK